MKTELQKIADSFIQLMKDFIQKNISGPYFKKQYFALWQPFIHHQDYLEIPEKPRLAINHVFVSVDAYCSDPALRGQYSIDEDQLREEVKTELLKIKPELEKEFSN